MTAIIGWAHSRFGRAEEELEAMIAAAAREAIAHAGVDYEDIGAIYLGNFGTFEKQGFPAAFALTADDRLRFTPATRVENACATGSAALHAGLHYIDAGKGRFALVVGAEKMSVAAPQDIPDLLLTASYLKEESAIGGGFAGVFAHIARAYFARYGDQSDAMAKIAAKNHKNGLSNPYAQLRRT